MRCPSGSRMYRKSAWPGPCRPGPYSILAAKPISAARSDIEEVIGFRDAECGVMEPRPGAGSEDDVVRVALALQEDEQQVLRSIRRDVFREPEAHAHPELACLLHVGHQQLE